MTERPAIKKAKVGADTGQEEAFQNTVLRPIIKMKHDLLIVFMRHYITKKKKDFASVNLENKFKYLNASFDRDQTLRSELRGMIIGRFTVEEYEDYRDMSNAINKRIVTIIKERMIDHMEILSN